MFVLAQRLDPENEEAEQCCGRLEAIFESLPEEEQPPPNHLLSLAEPCPPTQPLKYL